MPDHKPPPLVGDEWETLEALLRYQRESLLRKVSGLDETAARTPLVGSGTTHLWLVKHMARAELTWICHRFAGTDVALPHDTVEPADTLAHVVELRPAAQTLRMLSQLVRDHSRKDIGQFVLRPRVVGR